MDGVAESFYPAETAEHIKPLILKKLPVRLAASLNINRPPHETLPDTTGGLLQILIFDTLKVLDMTDVYSRFHCIHCGIETGHNTVRCNKC